MHSEVVGHSVMGVVMLAILLWFGLVPVDAVLRLAELLLAWAVISTGLVGCAGAWVALGRSRRPSSPQR